MSNTASNVGNWLSLLFGGSGYSEVQQSGVAAPAQTKLNFIGAVVADDPGNGRTNVTITALSATGTGFAHFTAGALDGAARAVNLATADVAGVLPIANGGTGIATTPSTTGQLLRWNGSAYAPSFIIFDGNTPPLGDSNPVFASDADHVATTSEYAGGSLYVTSTVSLTAERKLVLPLVRGATFDVTNATTGGQAFDAGGATGATVKIPNGSSLRVKCSDGANYVAISGGSSLSVVATVQTANFTAVAGNEYKVDTTTGALTVTLPSSPSEGDEVAFIDVADSFAAHNFTVAAAGSGITVQDWGSLTKGATTVFNRNGQGQRFRYMAGTAKFWRAA